MADKADLNLAISEAERFLTRAKAAQKRFAKTKFHDGTVTDREYADGPSFAAAKRSSMDLTRALAALRRPG